ncbi:MAG: sensor histidine kinase [Saccharospirillaceae bacterium]|nr:ATP-binding protein [Pseudomonadales bacterium]NRB80170.1 sensor histidine kinase [Saccharospirillaceae bacterium]
MFGLNKKDNRILKFHELTTKLSYATDISQLGYLAIEYALNNLDFDRLGLILYDVKNDQLNGTWGTDKDGILRNEENLIKDMDPELRKTMNADKYKGVIDIQQNCKLYDGDIQVGTGWKASIVIFHKNECLGWIFADNLINKQAITENIMQSLKLFGAIVSQLLVRIKSQDDFHKKNIDLENQNLFLEKTMGKLSYIQEQIIESEKLSALGRLVSSVAAELTGPINYSLKSTHEFKTISDLFYKKFKEGKIQEDDKRVFFQQIITSFNKIYKNQKKAFNLLEQFQTIASNQTDDCIRKVNIDYVIPAMIENIKQVNKVFQHEFIIHCDTKTTAKLKISLLTQVFNQLVTNSLRYAFSDLEVGLIKISISTNRDKSQLILEYYDNRKGDFNDLSKLFDPFSQKVKKELGLGNFIIYNIVVQKMKGYIDASSPKEGGLKYKISLPIVPC